MRYRSKQGGISVHAITGPYVVTLGFDATARARKGLLGFALHRRDHTENEAYWLRGFKTFEATAPTPPPGSLVSTQEHPVQSFTWGDYTAKPDHRYTYTVVPLYGAPKNLIEGARVEVEVQTGNERIGKHETYFNRGVAGSQAYARRFGNRAPDDIEDPQKQAEAWAWLSRGLEEALVSFLRQATGSRYALRAAVYEFSYVPILKEFGAAAKRGADVQIVYDHRTKGPWEATLKAAREAGITKLLTHPRKTGSKIAHNKFIVLLQDGKPVQVWTGSTNITSGGIFGQSNVGHLVRDAKVAAAYLAYWERLSEDPTNAVLEKANLAATPDPTGALPTGTVHALFSPRPDLGALEWYAERLAARKKSAHLTLAFGISATLAPALAKLRPTPTYLMVESEGNNDAARAAFAKVARVRSNQIAKGSVLSKKVLDSEHAVGVALHRWLAEKLTGLNAHVKYLHTKYMLVDPLSDDPTVISGSANFSKASTEDNDENMLVIRGDQEVADAYLGEFLRLFQHFRFRDVAERLAHRGEEGVASPYLVPDDSWTTPYFTAGTPKFLGRELLA